MTDFNSFSTQTKFIFTLSRVLVFLAFLDMFVIGRVGLVASNSMALEVGIFAFGLLGARSLDARSMVAVATLAAGVTYHSTANATVGGTEQNWEEF